MPRPGSRDRKVSVLISGEELYELKRHTSQMAEAFGLDRRIDEYQGKRPMGFYRWDLDCLLCVIEDALEDDRDYPDKNTSGFRALSNLLARLQDEYKNAYD